VSRKIISAMQTIADNGADVLGVVMSAAMLLYAPFARTWIRAILVVFVLAFCWSLLRSVTIIAYREFMPPLMGFVVLPFFAVAYACAFRGVKLLLFKIPFLAKFESAIRARFTRKRAGFRT
jgi:hypothetical protein